jgi:hypothetical protein
MSEPTENIAQYDAAVLAQLRLFCQLMLGSADAADCMIQQIYRRALDHHDEQKNWPSERGQLFRIAADLCGVPRKGRTRYCSGPGDDGADVSDML